MFNNDALGIVELELKSTGFLDFGTELANANFATMADAVSHTASSARESGVLRDFGLCGKAESLHFLGVLLFEEEFRKDVGWGAIQEKFRQAVT